MHSTSDIHREESQISAISSIISLLLVSPCIKSTLYSDVLCLIAHLCPILCDPMDCSLPGSSVLGILQARILEWVAMPSSMGSSQPRDRTQVSHTAGKFFTNWATREAQEYWSTLSLGQGIFPTQESNPCLLHCRLILYHSWATM